MGEQCQEDGLCRKPCTKNEECDLLEECVAGDCERRGCRSDRECILLEASLPTGDDARLSKCLPSDEDPTIMQCKVPCENDGVCGEFEVCEGGFCKFVGCDTDEECRSYLGIDNEITSLTKPWISTAVCRE
jgi:hypothetical protein